MKQNSPLDTVYFITLGEDFKFSEQAMHIDPSIPLPIQKLKTPKVFQVLATNLMVMI